MVGGLWYLARTYWRVDMPWMRPELTQVTRGDIRVPITASGLIEPQQRIEVKSKASGEVIEVHVAEGDRVGAGDVLVRLKQDDERRNVDRAQAEVDRAESLLATAKVKVEQAHAAVLQAEARVDESKAQLARAETELRRISNMPENARGLDEFELVTANTNATRAAVKASEASLKAAHHGVTEAQENVRLQEAVVRAAHRSLEDAQERLEETTITAKTDAIVTTVNVRVGEVIQGGQATFTGGTVLMQLADISSLKVRARVDESDYGRIQNISPIDALPEVDELRAAAAEDAERMVERTGKVKVTVDAFPELEFEGRLARVEPQGKLNAGASIIQFDVHVEIVDDRKFMLPLGTQAQVEFTVESVTDVLMVPSSAIKTHEDMRGVWVRTNPPPGSRELWGKRFVPVRAGITDGEHTQIVSVQEGSKLEVGDEIYTKLPRAPKEDDE